MIIPAALRYWPCKPTTEKPSGKRGVTSSARKRRQSASLTPDAFPILPPKKSSSFVIGRVPPAHDGGVVPAHALNATATAIDITRRKIVPIRLPYGSAKT